VRYAGTGHGAGYRRLSGGCKIFINWKLGFRQSSFRHITRVPQRPTFDAFAMPAAFLACCCPLHLSDPGKPSDPEIILQFLPAEPGICQGASWRTSLICRDEGRPSTTACLRTGSSARLMLLWDVRPVRPIRRSARPALSVTSGAVTRRGDGHPGAGARQRLPPAACSRFCRWRAEGDRHSRVHDRCRKMLMPSVAHSLGVQNGHQGRHRETCR
jgi:hypothetical protein